MRKKCQKLYVSFVKNSEHKYDETEKESNSQETLSIGRAGDSCKQLAGPKAVLGADSSVPLKH